MFLKDRLVTEPLLAENSSILPSPEDLKYKVLIRVKKTNKKNFSNLNLMH
jgi:hypothetical protein